MVDPASPADMGGGLGFFMGERGRAAPWSLATIEGTLLPGGAEALGARTLAVRREWRGLG